MNLAAPHSHDAADEFGILDAAVEYTESFRRGGVPAAFSELMAMMAGGGLVVCGRVGSLGAPLKILPAWWGCHLRLGPWPYDETLATPEGHAIYDVRFAPTGSVTEVDHRLESMADASNARPDAEEAAPADGFEAALRSIVTEDRPAARPWTWPDYEASFEGTGVTLNRETERVRGVRESPKGSPLLLATLLMLARYDAFREHYDGAATSYANLARALESWLIKQHPHLHYVRSASAFGSRTAGTFAVVLRNRRLVGTLSD